jgi:hypothetical protein
MNGHIVPASEDLGFGLNSMHLGSRNIQSTNGAQPVTGVEHERSGKRYLFR